MTTMPGSLVGGRYRLDELVGQVPGGEDSGHRRGADARVPAKHQVVQTDQGWTATR
jgi:hypothetical protein